MSRVIFMCGPAGAGKSTVARRLESEGFVRLSFDVQAWRRGIRVMPLPDDVRADIELQLREQLLALVAGNRDVVLDYSFWSRKMRDQYRSLLRGLSVEPETIYLATTREEVLERLRVRNGSGPDHLPLDGVVAAGYFDHFEPPTPDEGPLTVLG